MKPYRVYVLLRARKEIDGLPGHIRQRVRQAVIGLQSEPRPPRSKQLEGEVGAGRKLYRLRLEMWRVVYLVDEAEHRVYVLAARKRPPYRYADLPALLAETE
jgi:mRNA interferase RelE/StbE